MESSCDKILSKYKRRKAVFGREETGYVTRIGCRKSSNYYRIYQTKQGIKFELELKNSLIKSFQSFLFNNQIEIFEQKLAFHFYKLSINQVQLDSCYSNWLVSWIKKLSKNRGKGVLETTYLNNHNLFSFEEKELIYNLFRVLPFFQLYQNKGEHLNINGDSYCTISFPLRDLVDHLDMDKSNKRHIKKVSTMLHNFMVLGPITEFFSDIHFRALVLFPSIKIISEGRKSIVYITFVEEFFSYNFPCYFTSYFQYWDNKYQFKVQFEIIKIMSTYSIQKKLHVKDFLSQFKVSNKKQTEIKRLILESLQELVKKQIINSFFKTTQKNGSLKMYKNLTLELITKSEVIYLEEMIHYKDVLDELESSILI